jgi:hypothetical protein
MTATSVSETHSETRAEMACASQEIAAALQALAVRLEPLRGLATQIRRLAAIFARLELEARSDRPMCDLAPVTPAFLDVATDINESVELISLLASNFRMVDRIAAKIAHASDLAGQALLLVDAPL